MTAPDREGAAVEALAGLLAEHFDPSGCVRNHDMPGDEPMLRAHSIHLARAVIAAGWVPQSEVAEWKEAATKFCDDYHEELNKRIDAEQRERAVREQIAQAIEAATEPERGDDTGAERGRRIGMQDAARIARADRLGGAS